MSTNVAVLSLETESQEMLFMFEMRCA